MNSPDRLSVPILTVIVLAVGTTAYVLVQSYVLLETRGVATTRIVRTAWFVVLAAGIALLAIKTVLET